MKRILSLFSILILGACSPATPAYTSYFDDLAPADLDGSAAQPAQQIQAEALPMVTDSSVSAVDAGELYFFLQPRLRGEEIELARVSGACILDGENCPPVEKIAVPFALNFTINALSWSPDGSLAAFAYSDNPSGTPQKLFIFDPIAKTWTSIAEFPYIDPPFWSADGSLIAFRTQDGLGNEDAYVIGRDGTGLKNVSGSLPGEGKPYVMDGWYADSIIMRPGIPGSAGGIYLLRASDRAARPMFDDASLTNAQFIISPDASLFVYDDYDYVSQKHELKSLEPDGANPVTLASFLGGNLYPIVWSPDSQLIAFNYNVFTDGAPAAHVYAVSREGSKISSVYKGVTIGRLIFSPGGKYLLVEETTSISGGHLFVINLATLEKKILQAPGLSTDYDWYAPSWRP